MWVSTHQLVVNGACNIGKCESALLFGNRGVELNLVQQVAKFFNQCIVGGWVVGIEIVNSVNHFVCLFKQVLNKRLMRLLDVPWALLAQCACKLMQFHHFASNGLSKLRTVQRGEVVCRKHAVEFLPRGVFNALIGKSKVMQKHHRFISNRIIK